MVAEQAVEMVEAHKVDYLSAARTAIDQVPQKMNLVIPPRGDLVKQRYQAIVVAMDVTDNDAAAR